ncbi:MAG: DUF3618 domain-containing protein [Actinomycetales bacterium]|nr:DUF3618 domain-containing protein [Actinomycetales bacterium]
MPVPRVSVVEEEIRVTRERLADRIGQLEQAATPAGIAQSAVQVVRGFYVDEDGFLRIPRVAATVGVVVGLIVLRRLL